MKACQLVADFAGIAKMTPTTGTPRDLQCITKRTRLWSSLSWSAVNMNRQKLALAALVTFAAAFPPAADAGTLRGSPSSMKQQHEIAVDEDLTFTKKPDQVEHLVDSGTLVRVVPNSDFAMSNVSFPYVRPEVLLFIQRLAAQYHADNDAKLVVTSLTRPAALQPKNAHKLSVHPAGMAVDFRVPATASQRAWLENALLGLENASVLDVTREKNPPHYHVAVFPAEYLAYASQRLAAESAPAAKPVSVVMPAAASPQPLQAARPESHLPLIAASAITLLLLSAAPVAARRLSARVR